MLWGLWHWLKSFFQRLFGTSPHPFSQRGGSRTPSPRLMGGAGGTNSTLKDADYEVLFVQLLEGVSEGWSRGQVSGFLIGKRITEVELVQWLPRFAEKLLEAPEQHQELARRMVWLGQLRGGELGDVSQRIGRQLQQAQVSPSPESTGRDDDRSNNIWYGDVIEADFVGDGLTAPADTTAQVAASTTEEIPEAQAVSVESTDLAEPISQPSATEITAPQLAIVEASSNQLDRATAAITEEEEVAEIPDDASVSVSADADLVEEPLSSVPTTAISPTPQIVESAIQQLEPESEETTTEEIIESPAKESSSTVSADVDLLEEPVSSVPTTAISPTPQIVESTIQPLDTESEETTASPAIAQISADESSSTVSADADLLEEPVSSVPTTAISPTPQIVESTIQPLEPESEETTASSAIAQISADESSSTVSADADLLEEPVSSVPTTAISPTPQIVESTIQPLDTESEETTIEEIIESPAKESSSTVSADVDLLEEPVSSVPTTAISPTPQIVESAIQPLDTESEETTASPAVAQISADESSSTVSADVDLLEEPVSSVPTTAISPTPQIVESTIQPLEPESEETTASSAIAQISADESSSTVSADVDLLEEPVSSVPTTAISPTPQIVESAIQPLDTESEETTIEEIIESPAKESSVSESADADLVEEPVSSVPTTAISASPQIVESPINQLDTESEETTIEEIIESPAKESSVSVSADADLVEEPVSSVPTTAISPTPQIVESAIQPLDTESEETTIEEIIESRAKESSVSESADADLVEEPVSSVPTTAISATPQIVESAINRLEPESEETTESPAVAQISTKESSVSESADADLVELVSEIPTTVTSATPQIVGSAIQPLDTEEEAEETTTEATAESPDEALVRLSSDVDLEEEIAAETATRTTELTEIDESSANQASAVTEATTDGVEVWFNKGLQQAMAGDFQAAIANWNKALELKPDFYEAWNNRGNALANIGEYEEAIASYDRAVEYKPDYYQAWYNRGNALGNLGQHEEAIGCYSKAVEYKPDFYQAWYNKGCALYNVGQQEDAIASYSKALEFKSDYHQAWYNQGTLLYNIGKNEEAIAAYDRVIKFKPEDQQAWINRGIAARDSIDYNSTVASVSATQNQDLNLRGYEGELTSYQEGLKYCQQDTHPEGWGDLHRAIGNAHYFKGRSAPNPSDYYRQAVDEYNEALKTLTEADFPELHLEVLQSLVRADLGLGQKDEAAELHQRGIELLQRLLNEPQRSQYSKKQLALKQAAFQQLTVDIAIQSGQFIEALEAAEVGKNSCLYWLLYGWKDNVSSPKYAEIQQLLNPKTAVVYWHISPCALTTFIIKHDAPAPIVLPANRSLEKNEYLNRLVKFENWVKDWNQQYQEYQSKNSDALAAGEEDKSGIDWRDKLPETIAQLRQILGISTIELLLAGIDKLIFIPHRDLHRLPLHALFADKFRIAYLPSAQIGLNLLEKSSSSTQQQAASTLLSVEQPESAGLKPLLFAKIESGAIGQMFPNPTRLVGPSCTRPQLETLLQQPHSIFHFAGYSTDNSQNPSRSALALSGDDKLTLAEIVQIPFNEYQLIALSACETAVKGNQTISSEYVGLVSGFLYQGASHVLSTLWTVDDFSTALFTIRFYQLFKAGATPTVAFKEAQNWLRSVTYAQLAEWYVALPTDEIRDTDPEGWEHLQSLAKHIQDNSDNSSDPPYSHPYYWAGFTIAGKVNS